MTSLCPVFIHFLQVNGQLEIIMQQFAVIDALLTICSCNEFLTATDDAIVCCSRCRLIAATMLHAKCLVQNAVIRLCQHPHMTSKHSNPLSCTHLCPPSATHSKAFIWYVATFNFCLTSQLSWSYSRSKVIQSTPLHQMHNGTITWTVSNRVHQMTNNKNDKCFYVKKS